ncbi:MAG: DUF3667 domain-containing protein [Flavobacteriaceae bacterium]
MELTQMRCKNCGKETTSTYCAHCGQRSSVHQITFKETFHDLADNLFSISAPLPKTLRYLVSNPGRLLREYLQGKRKSYYKPISFFILTTVFYIFVRWAIDFDIQGKVISTDEAIEQMGQANIVKAQGFMFQNINNLLFFFVFSLSSMLKVFFYKKYTLSEYIAVAFYLVGFYSLLTTTNIFFIKFFNLQIQFLAILAMLGYFVYAMIRFFQKRPFVVAFKSVLAYFFAYLLYGFLAFGFSYLVVVLSP